MDMISMAADNGLGEKLAINIATIRAVYAPWSALERKERIFPSVLTLENPNKKIYSM